MSFRIRLRLKYLRQFDPAQSAMKLADWLEAEHLTQSEFAVRIGTSQAAVARYASGIRIPRREHMAAIIRETGGLVTAVEFYAHVPTPPKTVAA